MYKVMIVDDDLPIIEYFESYNWNAISCQLIATGNNGKNGFEKYLKFKPDIIITDIVMPLCDGIELSQKIRQISDDTEIIFLTSYEDFNFAKSAITLGITDYVIKGLFTDEEIVNIITRCIGKLQKRRDKSNSSMAYAIPNKRLEILRAADYVQDHYKDDISLETISCLFGFSSNYFGMLFKKFIGVSFREYLTKVRMEKAYSLLTETQLKIYEIAQKVGIPNYRYFISVFQNYFRITPKKIRGGTENDLSEGIENEVELSISKN